MISRFFTSKTIKIYGLFLVFVILFGSCAEKNYNPVIAHRGAWKMQEIPENSIAALKEAISLDCYGSEFDVHLTKDDIPVVNHDKDFLGIDIETSTYEELLAKQLPNGENIPTLKAYLEEGLKQKNTKLILEIKSAPSGKERTLLLTKLAVEMVHDLNGRSMVEYICFDYDAGILVSQLDPNAEVAYLNGDKTPAEVKKVGYTGLDYNYMVYKKNPTWIKEAQELGLTVNAWTVNKEEDVKELLEQKVDYITTNEPELVFEILNR
ncbi:Glycerophosphodiester phosphodiesterase [Arenibacter antarcticus]|uniref:Glycerophosphodiester phosphodiesterase family protein n=1 Tax=Arenibacter antarcticus TaxID=2040469 RepID=A0ABW5VFH7_9FLAO|nr:glycerophosphodiester phosphodiesterase family protein [Arenibacter sp. H213]MCM4166506.1 glycerophosphodiester phosphodiesterase [Arenibacter sp. H213]